MQAKIIFMSALTCVLVLPNYAAADQASKEKLDAARKQAADEYAADISKGIDRAPLTKWGDKFSECAGVYYVASKTMERSNKGAAAKLKQYSTSARKVAVWHYAYADKRANPFKYYLRVVDPIQKKKMLETINMVKTNNINLYKQTVNDCARLDIIQMMVLKKFNEDNKK